ncbi:MAG: pilus assembly PilX N-terminal domain-containing protein [Gammaproteobacteria bacterium]
MTVTLVILVIITLMVIFAAKVGMFDLRMSANEYRYKEAFATADGGLEYAIQQFAAQVSNQNGNYIYDPNGDGVADPIPSPFLNNLNLAGGAAAAGETTFTANVGGTVVSGMTIYTFSSTGQSRDRKGTATVSKQMAFRSVLGGTPPEVPVIADGTVDVTGNMHVVPNPNASCPAGTSGSGCAVSVWTHSSTSGSGSVSTCQIQGFSGGQCPNPTIDPLHTQITNANAVDCATTPTDCPDVVQNDNYTNQSPPGHFPPDLLEFLFGTPTSQWDTVMEAAKPQVYADCSGLGPTSKGLIWITGDCSINGSITIGSAADPVILVIQDHALSLGGGALIYGIVYVFDSPVSGTPSISTGGNVEIRGSLISDANLAGGAGTFAVVWDGSVFDNIENNSDESYRIVSSIPGSWRDF